MNPRAKALLEAHVRHVLDNARETMLADRIEQETSCLFDWLGDVPLDQIATREQVCSVIDRTVIGLNISGGITELAGEMSSRVFCSVANESTRLKDIVAEDCFDDVVDKVVSLDDARHTIISLIARSSAFRTLMLQILERGVLGWGTPPADGRSTLVAEVRALLERRLMPELRKQVWSHIRPGLERSAQGIMEDSEMALSEALDETRIRVTAEELWERLGPMPLSALFARISRQDLEDFVVIGYEFWLKYRKTAYFREVTRDLVGYFFDKYGAESVASIIEDMGVTRSVLVRELNAVALPVVKHALATGYLEGRVRAQLEPFYASLAVEEALRL